MIKVENFGDSIQITGHPEQIALEFEDLARAVRSTFCNVLGEDLGIALYTYALDSAQKSESERAREADEMYELLERTDPEHIKRFMESPIGRSFRNYAAKAGNRS